MELLLPAAFAVGVSLSLRRPAARPRAERRIATLPGAAPVPRRRLRPWAVVALGVIALATQLFVVAVMAGTILLAHVVAIVAALVIEDVGPPEVTWELATSLFGTPEVLQPLAVLACLAAVIVTVGRRTVPPSGPRGLSPGGPRRPPRGGSRPAASPGCAGVRRP